ncbi:MHS family MFS transporter [Sphingomonas piscis]|uniref:MHS family MFS transporter n=1 Tax=Sphingomonas piscis TaxID=2714943 RepID=A0A6G7YNM3_9SPHN|nr:MFS transporter [Sphingomonas piscis]QIK78343.1 MHS family MFS transporter [Sphingomonas piscis]
MADNKEQKWGMTRVIAASSAGTAFEWYDFFIFGTLASTVQKVFFAGLDPTSGLIAALGLFAAGFAFRPLGAIIFGVIGDRLGRKGAFLITVSLMGGATFAIGLLPTYATAGLIAPMLLILLRILQGIALGGEYGGAAIYVAEHAPDDKRGAATGWIQSSASFGLLAALLVILLTRTSLGEEAFAAWGWRIPFLFSAVLLAISIWLRSRLSESPEFIRLKEEGAVTKAPLREAFANRESLKRVFLAFFAIMCAQGAVWYAAFFYTQVFLGRSVGLAEPIVNQLLIIMTLVSAPLYVFFGWLSDKVGRKPVMLGGMLLALALYFPGFHMMAQAANPALVAAQRATPVVVATNASTCAVQFDPVGTAQFRSACDIAKSLLSARGISYKSTQSGDGSTKVIVGGRVVPVEGGDALSGAALKAHKAAMGERIGSSLAAAGYPKAADPRAVNLPLLLTVLILFVIAATALYGPQASALVEMFPTRVRYTALSLPYHVGTGWVGGFLPVTGVALAAITGNIYSALWYPVVFTAISAISTLLFLKETKGIPLDQV